MEAEQKIFSNNGNYIPCKKINDYFLEDEHNKRTKKNIITVCHINNILPFILHPIYENHIILDYRYLKHIITPTTFVVITNYLTQSISNMLKTYPQVIFHIYLKNLTLLDVDKYYQYITQFAQILSNAFSNKLQICYIYETSFIFSQILKIVSPFIDKETHSKIVLVKS